MQRSTQAALFADHRLAVSALQRLQSSGYGADDLTLIMSARTAERDFSLTRRDPEVPARFEGALLTLATELRPIAPLNAPGSGTVAAGSGIALLERAGLGTTKGLAPALEQCGVEPELARSVFERLRSGGVLVLLRENGAIEHRADTLAAAAARFELNGDDTPVPAFVVAPVDIARNHLDRE